MTWTLSIEVTSAQGNSQLFNIDADQARIGSAAHCEIRLPLGEAAAEHVALRHDESTVFARALASAPPALIDGEAFDEEALTPRSVLTIGATRLRVRAFQSVKGARRQQNGRRSSPWVYVALPALLAYAIATLPRAASNQASVPKQAPELFGASESCPEKQPSSARALGREQLNVADWKRERRPFHAGDGVRAVHLYRLAAACFDGAGDPVTASQARAIADHLQLDLEESYRTHRVLLEHALSINDYLVASREVRALLDLTSGVDDEYVTWLRSLVRRIKLREETKT